MKKFIFIFFFFCFISFPCFAAEPYSVFNSVIQKLLELLHNVQGVVIVLGGFGLVAIAQGAVLGKISYKRAGALAVGLIISSMTLAICSALVDQSGSGFGGEMAQFALSYDQNPDVIGGSTVYGE